MENSLCVCMQVVLKSPDIPGLATLLNKPMQPVELLQALSQRGLHLMPEDRDAPFVKLVPKDRRVERCMCEDISLLAGSHLIASSAWSHHVKVRILSCLRTCRHIVADTAGF
jgi:hypothetical protein